MSDNVCRVWKVEYPIVGDMAAHNFQAYFDEHGNLKYEVHGLATDKYGNIKPIGYRSDDLLQVKYYKDDFVRHFYNSSYNKELLFEGDCSVMEQKYQLAHAIGDEINSMNLHYPFFGLGENSNSVNTTLNIGVFGKDPDIDNNKIDIGQGHLLIPKEQLEEISDNFHSNLGSDSTQTQEVSLTGNETELPDIVVTAEKPEQVGNNNTPNFAENYNIGNSNNFFGDYLNQYAEENGISHINTYDYRQFANDDNSSNRISYLNDYNLSFGSGYWGSQYYNNNSTWDNSSNNIITEIELEKILDGNDEDKIKDTIMDLESGQLKIDTNGASSVLSSLEKKLEEYNISKLQIDDAILDNHNYSNSSISWENDNTWNDMSWEMNTINNQIQYEYYLYQKYLEEKEFWENMQIIEQTHSNVSDLSMDNNDDNSSSDNQNIKYEDNQSLSIQDDNTVSGSLNNNNNGEDNNVIAKVSDNPIILVKDENGIDKAMSVSEYAQYQNLLQDNLNNAFNHAQQTIQEQVNNDFDDFKQELHNNLVNLEQQFNQQLDEIASQEENSSIVDNENLDSDIADNLNNSDDMADLDLSLIDNHHGDSVSSDLSVIDDDIFSVVSDEEIFATHYDERWECKEEDPDDYWF